MSYHQTSVVIFHAQPYGPLESVQHLKKHVRLSSLRKAMGLKKLKDLTAASDFF